MNKITFPREGLDGQIRTQEFFEKWMTPIENEIRNNLSPILSHKTNISERLILKFIINNLNSILLASPEKLNRYKKVVDTRYPNKFFKERGKTNFGEEILNAFKYKNFRKDKLIKLAMMLNVKTCPYCNMHYTLYAENGSDRIASFQFDHFFDKGKYPMLSMSLYNLIPSCTICNQKKSTKELSLEFHPYYADIHQYFKFEVTDPLKPIMGGRIDIFDLSIKPQVPVDKTKLDKFLDTFSIRHLYSRHRDIAQETFDKAYEDPYYTNPANFSWLCSKDPGYIQRLWLGTYVSKDEIEKRPMTKFIQDLWEQAQDIKIKSRIFEL